MEKKYIIELPENTHWIEWVMTVSEDNRLHMGFKHVEDLTPYTEPDLDAIRKEEYEKGVQDTKQHWVDALRTYAYKLGYENGLNDAWEAVRKISHMDSKTRDEIFGLVITSNIVDENTASEAIEKIRAYEQAQKEKEEPKKESSITAEEVMRQYLDRFCNNKSCSVCPLYTSDFTCGRGHHFLTSSPISDEEVRRAYATVLAKMKEKEE